MGVLMGFYDRDYARDSSAISTFSSRVYGLLSIGLAFTAAIAYFLYRSGLYMSLIPYWWVWMVATFGVAMAIKSSLDKLSIAGALSLFLAYAGLEGMFFGTVLPVFAISYGGEVIWSAFATGSAIFGVSMLYGIFTKSDLTNLGKILALGLVGLFAVTLVYFLLSFFIPMKGAYLLISYVGLALFVGLTAYDAQTIRRLGMQVDVRSVASYKLSMIMALKMYINVIMIFWYLLQIFSSSRK